MKKMILFIFTGILGTTLFAQQLTKQQYIQTYKDLAISEMKRTGVPAAITLAQGILETENGNSDLFKKSNNHFGIKCKSNWTGKTVYHDDDAAGECFRVYTNAEDSYRDHSDFLKAGTRYSFLFQYEPSDYKSWAYGLRKAGYATNPRYPEILIKNIEEYNLQQYTLAALNGSNEPQSTAYRLTEVNKPAIINIEPVAEPMLTTTYVKPEKVVINGTKAIWAIKGVSLLAIATAFQVNLNKMLEFNDLDHDGLVENDQYIFLEKKPREGEKPFYIVSESESIYQVAQKNGVRLKSICEYNNLGNKTLLKAGTKVLLKPGVASDNTATANSLPPGYKKVHQVVANEGLQSIAKKYGVTPQQIQQWNSLPDDHLKIGQQLIVSN